MPQHISEATRARRPYRAGALLAATAPMILPVLDSEYRRVLDLGCGMNDTLSKLALPDRALRVGLDVAADEIKAAHRMIADVRYAVGDGHALPFRAGAFDLVISKVALPYMNIPVALRDIHRVLREGGQVWTTLHPLRMAAMRILRALKTGRLKDVVHQSYAILNGWTLENWGRQFRYPLNRRRIESLQTIGGIARALLSAGFSDVRFEVRSRGPGYADDDRQLGEVFAVAARKPVR